MKNEPDGIAGPVTIGRLNHENPGQFLIKVYNSRVAFIRNIIRNDPTQKRFEKGWMNRVNEFI
ncbi:MAG: hypothetical protein M0P47_02645 [Bacteroidales bacterium]|nr:hypothetical protein [Bacteroidales bacterium]